MRVLVLCKRQYTDHDLLDDRFGRLRELPLALATAGNEVEGICLSYRRRDEGWRDDVQGEGRVTWKSLNLRRLLPGGAKSYWQTIEVIKKEFHPDLVWSCSDALHAILGVPVARRLGATLVTDLYDNFESFPITRFPGLTTAFYRALRRADGITFVSQPLAQYVREKSSCQCPVEVIENAVPEGVFRPMGQAACRRELGLPEDGLMVGTAGALSQSRGIETLLQAFEKLARQRTDLHLVLAGARDKGLSLPRSSRIHYLGMLPQEKVPVLLSALDISVICNRESAFGRYCFPQKFHESVACGVPVIAAATGAMKELLKDTPANLFEPDNAEDLVSALRRQIDNPSVLPLDVPTWNMLGKRLESFFRLCLESQKRPLRDNK